VNALSRAVVVILVVVLGYVLLGGVAEARGPVMLVLPLAILALGATLSRRPRALVDLGWAGRASAHGAPVAPVGADGWVETSPVAAPRAPATRRQVAAALARVEAREWLASPWFATGIGFCTLLIVLFGFVWARSIDGLEEIGRAHV
jgi:hypothetical protein